MIACDCCDWFSEFESDHVSCKLCAINIYLYFSREYGDGRMFLTLHLNGSFESVYSLCQLSLVKVI